MSYFDYDPELPAGFQDADLEMAELIEAGNRSGDQCDHGWRKVPPDGSQAYCLECNANLCEHLKDLTKCFACSGQTFEDTIRDDPDFRVCADCEHYSLVKIMITKADGRVICRTCQKAIDDAARESAQSNLFVQQPNLF